MTNLYLKWPCCQKRCPDWWSCDFPLGKRAYSIVAGVSTCFPLTPRRESSCKTSFPRFSLDSLCCVAPGKRPANTIKVKEGCIPTLPLSGKKTMTCLPYTMLLFQDELLMLKASMVKFSRMDMISVGDRHPNTVNRLLKLHGSFSQMSDCGRSVTNTVLYHTSVIHNNCSSVVVNDSCC